MASGPFVLPYPHRWRPGLPPIQLLRHKPSVIPGSWIFFRRIFSPPCPSGTPLPQKPLPRVSPISNMYIGSTYYPAVIISQHNTAKLPTTLTQTTLERSGLTEVFRKATIADPPKLPPKGPGPALRHRSSPCRPLDSTPGVNECWATIVVLDSNTIVSSGITISISFTNGD